MAQPSSPASPPPAAGAPAGIAALSGQLRELLEEGMAHQRARRFKEAEQSYRRAVREHPNQPDALNLLATLVIAAGGAPEAARLLKQAVRLRPDDASFRANLAGTLVLLDRLDEALAEVEAARRLAPDALDVVMNHAGILRRLGRPAEAMAIYERVLETQPGNHIARIGLARCQYELDLGEESAAGFRAVQAERPNDPAAYVELAAIGAAARWPELLAATERLAASGEMPPPTRRGLYHAAARIAEDLGRHDEAFAFAAAAKTYLQRPPQPEDVAAAVNRLIAVFDEQFFAAKRGQGDPTARPVFIVGLPRSGTAVVARLLGTHPQVANAGELPRLAQLTGAMAEIMNLQSLYPEGARDLTPEASARLARRYLDALNNSSAVAGRVVDATPTNFEYLGLVALLFPNARVIACRRDPLDLGLACYMQSFPDAGPPLHEFEQIAQCIREHERLMAHWRRVLPMPINEVVYEDLAATPDIELRRLVGLLGIPWDDHCAAGVTDGSVARTMLTRDPPGRARWFDKYLAPLKQALS